MVSLMRANLQTLIIVQGSWNDDNVRMPKVMVESSNGVDVELGPIIKGSPQYYHRQGHLHQ
jgi:hypothetical protein